MPENNKHALKGFANFGAFLVTEDSGAKYTVGAKRNFVGARSCTVSDQRTEYKIPGDDGVYDQGADYESTTLEIVVNQMLLEDLGFFTGAEYTGADKTLTEADLDNAPAVAIVFSALKLNKGYRLYKYFNAKLTSYKVDHKTKLESGQEVNTYTLTFVCSARKTPNTNGKRSIRDTIDIENASGLSALDTIAAIGD